MKMKLLLVAFEIVGLIWPVVSQIPANDLDHRAKIRADMIAYNPHYEQLIAERKKKLNVLAQQVFEREAQGQKMTCPHQILIETRWLMGYTADFSRLDQRLSDLKKSLAHPERESLAKQQDASDGSWGGCYAEWFERLDISYDVLQMEIARGITPRYRMSLLDRINSPEKLKAYFASITTSDVAHTGRDNRKELNAAFVDLIRLIDAGEPAGYPWNPQLKQTLMELTLNTYRNQETGWWGETYISNAKRAYIDD